MHMPEAAVDKDDNPVFGENEIRFPGVPLIILSVPQPLAEQILPHKKLRFGVLAANPRHIVAFQFWCMIIVHRCTVPHDQLNDISIHIWTWFDPL